MKFSYQYRTSDNQVRGGVITASDRDAVFAALRKRGIKPYGVEEAPGFFNKLFGKGKRWTAICLLAVVTVALLSLSLALKRETVALKASIPYDRQQVYGDPALMDRILASGFAEIFSEPGDRFLACYAQPGIAVALPQVSDEQIAASLKMDVAIAADDSREVRELKAIVNGMKRELRDYLDDGVGTVAGYRVRLKERLAAEISAYDEAVREINAAGAADISEWERINGRLRAKGLRTLPLKDIRKK